jgi:hypothetical protein
MMKRWLALLMVVLCCVVGLAFDVQAQEKTETTAEKQEEKTALEKKAVTLLEQVATESGALRLAENRIRLQIILAGLLWPRNEGRARSTFDAAAASLVELTRGIVANRAGNRRGNDQGFNWAMQLRQELVMTAAQHNSTLAYQLLQTTRLPVLPNDSPYNRQPNMDANLEQALMTQIARIDPQLAIKNAEELLDKGQYPFTVLQVIAELQNKDKAAWARLSERLTKQLLVENLYAKPEAANLILMLLRYGPRLPESQNVESGNAKVRVAPPNRFALLDEATFRVMLEQVINAALKDTTALNAQKSATGNAFGPDAMQRDQSTSRMLVSSLQGLMPQIEKYAPTRVAPLRQKMGQMGFSPRSDEYNELMRQGTTESLLAAAAKAPDQMRASLYQRAALKAVEEGNLDRARQITNDHLEAGQRDSFLRMIESRQMASKDKELTMESVRQSLSRLPSDEERFNLMIELAVRIRTDNPKLALQILEEAQKSVGVRAMNYEQFNDQLQLARAYVDIDAPRSFELLDPGISQLNELFPAAQTLSGFDVSIFKDGEMLLLQGGGRLAAMVNQYAEQIAILAQKDFDRAVTTAEKFQLPEARLFVRLGIARAILSGQFSNRYGRPGVPLPPPPRQP